MKKKTRSKNRYQANPYALQTRKAATAPRASTELVPVIVQPRRRRFARTRQRAKARVTSSEFLAETGIAATGAGAAAVATGWMAGKGWNPWAVGATTAVIGGIGAVFLPGAWKGAGVGMTSWGVGQLAATVMQQHAIKEFQQKQKELEQQKVEQQKALEQAAGQAASGGQKALPEPAKRNAAFMPSISDAFSNARSYGHYGRADDEERMTDLDLVLG